jgi:hypothetical protein
VEIRENQVNYDTKNGHRHDGIDSTPVELQPNSVDLTHLSAELIDWITDFSGYENDVSGGATVVDAAEESEIETTQPTYEFAPVPDLTISIPTVQPNAELTGQISWTNAALVSFVRVVADATTKCDITFYHKSTYLMEDREFRAVDCANNFLWEGIWAHYDEEDSGKIYYRIRNTGSTAASFMVYLRSATMATNPILSDGASPVVDHDSNPFIDGPARYITQADMGTLIRTLGSGVYIVLQTENVAPIPIGSSFEVVQYSSGGVKLDKATGVTIRIPIGKTDVLAGLYSLCRLFKVASNTWLLSGDLALPGGGGPLP